MARLRIVLVGMVVLLSTGCSSVRINDEYAHLVTDEVKYDICTVTTINRNTTKDSTPDEEIAFEVACRMEGLLLDYEEFAGASVGKVKNEKGRKLVVDSFAGLDRNELGNSVVSKPLVAHFREKGTGTLLLLIRHDGFYRSGGSRALGLFAGLVTSGASGGHVTYSQYSALSMFEFCLIDEKSGQVIAYDGEAKETDPRGQGRLAACVRSVVKGIEQVREKGRE